MRGSIRIRLTLAFIGLAIGPLLLVGIVLARQSFTAQERQALNLQREVAQRVSTQVMVFFQELEGQLRIVSQVQGLQTLDRDRQRSILSELLSYQDVFEELALLDDQGQEQIHLSRINPLVTLGNRAEADEFVMPQANGEVYYSPVRFEGITGEPLITIAVPLFNVRTGLVDGVLVSEARIKKIWDLIANVQVSSDQSAYIVDARNVVVAHRNPSIVLQGTIFNVPGQDGLQPGLTGSRVVLAVETIRLGQQEFNIVAEQEEAEALALAIDSIYIIAYTIVGALMVAGFLGFLIVRQIVRPIQVMATAAQAISAGDLSQHVRITRQDELGVLANAFNSMTRQLQELIGSLEQRVISRTHRLEIAASLSEHLSAILNLEELLAEVVNQVKESFGYYHAHIYLLDEAQQKLTVAAGTGEAGAEMKARGHSIPLNAPTSLVARAARTGQIVKIDNVREAPDWLPNPLLPNTYSEIALPIILEGKMVGVLDVQQDKIAGLDEGDANLLRTLANQAAVAIRNARQFGEVQAALAAAHELQQQYIEQAWDQLKIARGSASRVQFNLEESVSLDEAVINQVREQGTKQKEPAIVMIAAQANGNQANHDSSARQALVAPVVLRDVIIGNLQLHGFDPDRQWTNNELAFINAVVDQVAQAAENLRLFEETRERAASEQTIREVTNKLRAAPNLDGLLETAARELGQWLGVQYTVLELGIEAEAVRSDEDQAGYHNGPGRSR
jgi:GAF domain-containing protein/HAMP domain-containing protein